MLTSTTNIKQISTEKTIEVRHQVLRIGRPIEECYFTNDNAETTVHFGIYDNNILAGVATYLENNLTAFKGSHLQLRGMAVLNQFKGKGYGKLLLKAGEQLAFQELKQYLWCNARIGSKTFYTSQNYKTTGDSFEKPFIGTHFVMYKKITRI